MKSDLHIIAANVRRWRIENGFLRPERPSDFPAVCRTAATIRDPVVRGEKALATTGVLNSRPHRLESSPCGLLVDDGDQAPLFELRSRSRLVDMLFARDLVIVVVTSFALLGWALYLTK